MKAPNKPEAVNPAIARRLEYEDHWRRVSDLARWTKQMRIGTNLEVLDKADALLGRLSITEERSGAWYGVFVPTLAFEPVRPLFEEFASIVLEQSFAHLDLIEEKIAALELRGRDDGRIFPIFDLQIYGDGASVRTKPFRPA